MLMFKLSPGFTVNSFHGDYVFARYWTVSYKLLVFSAPLFFSFNLFFSYKELMDAIV